MTDSNATTAMDAESAAAGSADGKVAEVQKQTGVKPLPAEPVQLR